MPREHGGTANETTLANNGATGNTGTGGNSGIVTNTTIVTNHNLIIDLDPVTNHGIVQGTAVNAGVGTDFHIVPHNDSTNLRNLDPDIAIFGVAKTISTNHHPGMNHHAITDMAIMINRDIWVNQCVITNADIITNHHPGMNDRIAANFCGG